MIQDLQNLLISVFWSSHFVIEQITVRGQRTAVTSFPIFADPISGSEVDPGLIITDPSGTFGNVVYTIKVCLACSVAYSLQTGQYRKLLRLLTDQRECTQFFKAFIHILWVVEKGDGTIGGVIPQYNRKTIVAG